MRKFYNLKLNKLTSGLITLTPMKLIISTFFILIISTSFGQNQLLDSCGLDSNDVLNRYECQYLNSVFMIENFNFENKKIEFRYANYGHFSSNKMAYFKDVKDWSKTNSKIHEDIIILTEEEKRRFGEYDAVIISWSKIPVTGKARSKCLKKLSKSKT